MRLRDDESYLLLDEAHSADDADALLQVGERLWGGSVSDRRQDHGLDRHDRNDVALEAERPANDLPLAVAVEERLREDLVVGEVVGGEEGVDVAADDGDREAVLLLLSDHAVVDGTDLEEIINIIMDTG